MSIFLALRLLFFTADATFIFVLSVLDSHILYFLSSKICIKKLQLPTDLAINIQIILCISYF